MTSEDPVGATLKRTANIIENTPAKADEPDPRAEMLDLSRRPGAQHRRMYMWWSGAVVIAAVAMIVVGFQLRGSAQNARSATAEWRKQGLAAIGKVFPDALVDRPGVNKYVSFEKELTRLEQRGKPAKRTEDAMPVLEELETISLVVGNNGYAIESIDLNSTALPRFTVLANNTEDAEALTGALRKVSGSHVADWAASYSTKREGDKDKVRVTFTGRWAPEKGGAR